MAITVRIDPELERELKNAAHQEGLTRSELTRRCLKEFLAQRRMRKTAWELGKDLFGRFDSGRGDLSTRKRALVREKIHGKKGRR